jgi:multicomponent Na+:H+ antiporter subunit B
MSRRARLALFALAAVMLAPAVVRVALHMPAFGAHPLPYGDAINRAAPGERHVTNMVTAVNFDYRGLDTLGEEIMLFGAVTGAVMLLRGGRGENVGARPGFAPGRPIPARSDAVALIGRMIGPLVLLFGIYVVLHAQLTPGGGFQGGAIIGSGLLLYYLGEGYGGWRRLVHAHLLLMAEAGGAAAFALAGFGPMLVGAKFLQNVLPLGATKALLSGGLILVVNAAVAFAVAGGFGLLFVEFLEETRAEEDGNA